MNHLVRVRKILFKRSVELTYEVKQANIPDAGYEEHQSFPNDMGQNPENMLVPDVPCLICLKK